MPTRGRGGCSRSLRGLTQQEQSAAAEVWFRGGESGIGSIGDKYGCESLTHPKSVLASPAEAAIEHLYSPYTADKVEALRQWGYF